jgi:ParB family chromosome partitioning protein
METNDIIDTRADADSALPVDRAQEALRASAQDIIAHATIQTATHGQLVPSTANVRIKPSDLSQLHASIRAHGLLQNLVCFPQELDGAPTGLWEVAAGKNRWTVIGMLIAEGSLPYDFRIPFLLVTKAEAVLVSLAENLHAPMHPADLFDGMLTLSRQGRSADEIGWMFGLSAKTVRQRLKLANVAPRLFALYREDKASYEQMAALAISDDHQAQQAAWDGLDNWSRQPQRLRKLLTAHCIPVQRDPVVRYVGVKVYEAAGGTVLRDLFSTSEEGFIDDGVLLESLAHAKLDKVAEKLRKQRWAWVEVVVRDDAERLTDYGRVQMVEVPPTPQQQAALAACNDRAAATQAELDALPVGDPATVEQAAALIKALAAIDVERGKLRSALRQPDPAQRALAGVLVTLDENGKECVLRDMLKPQHKPKVKAGTRAVSSNSSDSGSGGGAAARTSKERPVHSERLTRLLTAQRTLALHAELVRQPDTAVLVLALRMIKSVFYGKGGDGVVQLQLTKPELPDEARSGPAWDAIEAQRAVLAEPLPQSTDSAELMNWLRNLPRASVDAYLAFCVGSMVNGVQDRERPVRDFEQLAQAVALDMHVWWKPTAENYFAHVNKQRMLDVVAKAANPAMAAPLEALRKDAAAAAAARALDGNTWLPAVLRGEREEASVA